MISGARALLKTRSQWTGAVIGTNEAKGHRYNNLPIYHLCLPNMHIIIMLDITITAYLAKERAAHWYVACCMQKPTLPIHDTMVNVVPFIASQADTGISMRRPLGQYNMLAQCVILFDICVRSAKPVFLYDILDV